MLLIFFFSSIQVLLFCRESDATITWTAPPPQRGPLQTSDLTVRRTIQQLVINSPEERLKWDFTLSGETLDRVTWAKDGTQIGRKTSSGIITIQALSNFREHFAISASDPATLIIKNLTEADRGVFQCSVETDTRTWADEIQVEIVDPPKLTNVSNGTHSVNEGSNLQLFCEADGLPPPNITWTKVVDGDKESKILHRGESWNFVNITSSSTGIYRCKAANGIGNPASQLIRVIVSFAPRIKLQNEYNVRREGSVSLDCQVEGYPTPAILWTPCNPQQNKCENSMLNISKVERDAVYNCAVKNDLGNASKSTNLIIAAKQINLTLTITDEKECVEGDTSFWDELQKAVDNIFANRKDYVKAIWIRTRCGSLIVDLALEFTSVVSEASILSTLRKGVIGGKLGGFTVNASSIVGIPVIESTATPPTDKTTTKPPDDKNIGLIVGASVGGFILLVIIIAVVIWCVRQKNNKDKDKRKKSKPRNKEVGDNDAEGHQMSRFQGGRPTSGHGNNGYENTGSIPRPPVANAGKKDKKEKKGQAEEDKPVGVVYAQVDKEKRTRKPKEPENLYDQAARPNSKKPGELQYVSPEDLQQGRQSMPRNSGTQPKKPEAYTETQYAVLV